MNLGGSQVDPAVAATSSGHRLFAATDLGASGGPRVEVWQPSSQPTTPVDAAAQWAHGTTSAQATQPAIAWDDGPTADLMTAAPSTTCAAAGGANVGLTAWTYHTGSHAIDGQTPITPLLSGGIESWPRMVLGAPGSTIDGTPITVADEQECSLAGHPHSIVVMWPGMGRPIIPLQLLAPVTDLTPDGAVVGRMPAVAVVGTDDFPPGGQNAPQATVLEIAYVSEPSNQQQDLLAVKCFVTDSGFPQAQCDAPVTVDTNLVPPNPVTSVGSTFTPVAAPEIACAAGNCHVVWTEGSGNRTRAYYSHAAGPSYTSWSGRQQVAGVLGNSASQFMPSVAVHGGRADVVYLDTRTSTIGIAADAFQTSFDITQPGAPVRGLDISLTNGEGLSPGPSDIGDRSAAVDWGAAGSPGALYAYYPDVLAGDELVSETQVDHGTVQPTLTVPGTTLLPTDGGLHIFKNTPVPVGITGTNWVGYSDGDGDPVTLTVVDPPHGTVSGSTYTPDQSYAGTDVVKVRVAEVGGSPVMTSHWLTIDNRAPTFDPPAPAIVDEGGTVVVPLQATDPDVGDIVNFSVIQPAPTPFSAAGRVTTVGNSLRLTVPANVRWPGPVIIWLQATDTTTGEAPLSDQASISVTIRPNLKTPSITVEQNVITGQRLTINAPISWPDVDGSCINAGTCNTRRTWTFGDGTAAVTVNDSPEISHVYAHPGNYRGTVTGVVLWGPGQIATAPQTFRVTVQADGRLIFKVTPSVKRRRTTRTVSVKVTARAAGIVVVSLLIKGQHPMTQTLRLAAGGSGTVRFRTFSMRRVRTHRGTIRVAQSGTLASGVPPTPVTRTIRF